MYRPQGQVLVLFHTVILKGTIVKIQSISKFVNNLESSKLKIKFMTDLRALLAHNIKERRQILGITQAQLAEKVITSTNYIGQIEQQSKFPTPEMLKRIALALEIDSPQLFSMNSFPSEIIRQFKEDVLSDLETALTSAIDTRLTNIQKMV